MRFTDVIAALERQVKLCPHCGQPLDYIPPAGADRCHPCGAWTEEQ